MKILPDGSQALIERKADYDARYGRPSIPNGFAVMPDGYLLLANLGMHVIDRMAPDGTSTVELDAIGGARFGEVNFVLRDAIDGYWATIATYATDSFAAYNSGGAADGKVIRVDSKGARVAAQNIAYANEVRLDAKREYLYVVESFGFHITRFKLDANDIGTQREIYGPPDLGGIPDGIAFDSFGNLWVTLIGVDQLGFITPEGDFQVVLQLGSADGIDAFRAALRERRVGYPELIGVSEENVRILTSLTFGGADLRTVYLGSVMGDRLACFRSPVAGLPMAHWVS
jgi:sugar lactone lactonase YvrE